MVGTTRLAIELCRELRKTTLDLVFVAPKDILQKEIAKEFNVKHIGIFSRILWEQIDLPIYMISKKKALLINFTNSAPIFYNYNIVALLDIIPLINPAWASKKVYLMSRFLVPVIAKRSLRIFTISEYSKKDIVTKLNIKPEKIDVIYCGVRPLNTIKNTGQKVESIKGKYILAVSSLEPRKNFINVVKAFNLLKDKSIFLVLVGPNFQFHIKELMVHIDKERTIIKGYVDDSELTELYKNAVAFVYPSLYEGFGLPPIEAMQYGCPVVTSNLTSIPEICGDAVLYVDPYSPEDIAEKMSSLINNNQMRLNFILKGHEKVKEYTWEKSKDLFLECIDGLKN